MIKKDKKILDFIISRKSIIPNEKINSIESLKLKLENGIFSSKDKFCSTLKGKGVGEEEYVNSKFFIQL